MKKLIAFLVAIVAALTLSVGMSAPAQAATTEFSVDYTGITLLNGNTWDDVDGITLYIHDGIMVWPQAEVDIASVDPTSNTFMGWWEYLEVASVSGTITQIEIEIDGVIEVWTGELWGIVREEPLPDGFWEGLNNPRPTAEPRCIGNTVYIYYRVTNSDTERVYTARPEGGSTKILLPGETKIWTINLHTGYIWGGSDYAYLHTTSEYNGDTKSFGWDFPNLPEKSCS